jgi:Flp pilus assembly protein TadG
MVGAHRERGASLIEFAILMPLLITLLLGVVEFAWLFSQNIDVRHGAREGARLAATDYGNETTIANETCDRMDIAGTAAVTVNLTRSGATIGDEINVTVTATPASLTGFFDYILPATLTSSIETRLEQSPSWSSTASPVACP